MKKKVLLLLGVILVLAALGVACDGASTTTSGNAAASPTNGPVIINYGPTLVPSESVMQPYVDRDLTGRCYRIREDGALDTLSGYAAPGPSLSGFDGVFVIIGDPPMVKDVYGHDFYNSQEVLVSPVPRDYIGRSLCLTRRVVTNSNFVTYQYLGEIR